MSGREGEMGGWDEIRAPARGSATVGGVEISPGSRVVLRPRAGGDIFDVALTGKLAIVESVEEDVEGHLKLAVTVEDDPGRDLGAERMLGHRFFFDPEEVEPMAVDGPPVVRVLVAGIGNVFLGDDGFGVALSRRLAAGELPAGVEVVDFGIRGMNLAYALGEGHDAAILIDASPRGEAPGTVYVIEPDLSGEEVALDTHGMDPVRVLRLAAELGELPPRILVVGCEPLTRMTGEEDEVVAELSDPVAAALDQAQEEVLSLLEELTGNAREPPTAGGPQQ